ncbi:GTP cyclohydrolase I FolE [Labrys monachus]|uniref:GTP cyclohydrolase 1 n=1 Tax=Labrys monachus TaxID=217067 RepID=A0ABU0FKE0_9HYPH|nr:GTP cyclohydrolase I FolE [Labrys monachus]MDQ0395081.1 GTP cyclohydrolase I [Labrys monachus]
MDFLVDKLPVKPERDDAARTPVAQRPSRKEAEAAVRTLIQWAGDDPDREGLLDTPRRVVKAWREMFGGYDQDVAEELDTVFDEVGGYGDIVLVRDIPFYSHCEHHIVPILGHAHIGYYPRDGVVGLSKLARVVEIYARRLQTQENLTASVVKAIEEHLNPRGLAVMMEAEHMCMAMRGIQKQGISTVTTGYTGVFKEDPQEQMRFLTMVRRTYNAR